MSIATVVTRGYGTPSYAAVNKLPTLGYSQGAATGTSVVGPVRFAAAYVDVSSFAAAYVDVPGLAKVYAG